MLLKEKRRIEDEWRVKLEETEKKAAEQLEKAKEEAKVQEDNSSFVHVNSKGPASQGEISIDDAAGAYYYEAAKSVNGSN